MATKTALPNVNGAMSKAHTAELREQKVTVAPARRKPGSKKAKDEGLLASLCTLVCDHQIGMPKTSRGLPEFGG
jgi:acyl-CoA-dependent ceramide synthase